MKPTTRYRTANPTATAPAHSGIAVDLPIGGGHSADRVKAAVADQLRSECGADHYVAARRINRQNSTVLHWSITAHCWPTDPAAAPPNESRLGRVADHRRGVAARRSRRRRNAGRPVPNRNRRNGRGSHPPLPRPEMRFAGRSGNYRPRICAADNPMV